MSSEWRRWFIGDAFRRDGSWGRLEGFAPQKQKRTPRSSRIRSEFRRGPRRRSAAAGRRGEEAGQEVEEVLRVDDFVVVVVGAGLVGEEGGEEVEEILGVQDLVRVEVAGALRLAAERHDHVLEAGEGVEVEGAGLVEVA